MTGGIKFDKHLFLFVVAMEIKIQKMKICINYFLKNHMLCEAETL